MITLEFDKQAVAHLIIALTLYRRSMLEQRRTDPFNLGLLDDLCRNFAISDRIATACRAPEDQAAIDAGMPAAMNLMASGASLSPSR